MRVPVWPEHRKAIEDAGYNVTWDKPEVVVSEPIPVLLVEHNGERRIGNVAKHGTEDDWRKDIVQKR